MSIKKYIYTTLDLYIHPAETHSLLKFLSRAEPIINQLLNEFLNLNWIFEWIFVNHIINVESKKGSKPTKRCLHQCSIYIYSCLYLQKSPLPWFDANARTINLRATKFENVKTKWYFTHDSGRRLCVTYISAVRPLYEIQFMSLYFFGLNELVEHRILF